MVVKYYTATHKMDEFYKHNVEGNELDTNDKWDIAPFYRKFRNEQN